MCGVNGAFAYHPAANPVDEAELRRTRDHMQARGPDGAGLWLSDDGRTGLAHRRLAVIDLSPSGAQPMQTGKGRPVLVFNGEIYNYRELRAELEEAGRVFASQSDTEVLLHLYELHGAEMLARLRGMFALAIWDPSRRELFLARDPYGIKPLYIADDGWTCRFASQVKALLAGGAVSRDPEPAGAVGFLLWGSVPEPFTLYQEIRALPAGHYQRVTSKGPDAPVCYASVAETIRNGAARPAAGPDAVKQALTDSVRAHLVADVEVGLFLSGGVDSTSILSIMSSLGCRDIRTLNLGFSEFGGTVDDETVAANRAARRYGARHVCRMVSRSEFDADLPRILAAMDQPSIDGVNSWFVSKAAQEAGLKVAMTGVGGDELFAGYPSYRDVPNWVRWLTVPSRLIGLGLAWRKAIELLGIDKRQPKLAGLVSYGGSYAAVYFLRRGLFLPGDLAGLLDAEIVAAGLRRLQLLQRIEETVTPFPHGAIARIAALESSLYLRNQLLRDIDWASMAHSLEVRTPFVDYCLLQQVASAIGAFGGGRGKALLRSMFTEGADEASAKTGFSVPLADWVNDGATDAMPASRGQASRFFAQRILRQFAAPLAA